MTRVAKIVALSGLGLVLGLFALLGFLFLTRGTPLSYVSAFGDHGGPPAVGDAMFVSSLSLLAPLTPVALDSVEIYSDGRVFDRLLTDMSSARQTLTVQIYYAEPGRVADRLAAVLAERARAGVSVLLLYDAFGAGALGGGYYDALREAGVAVAEFRPVRWYSLHKAQERAHVRAIVVDGRIGWTGGFGIADQWLGDGRHEGSWRDTNVRFTGGAARQLQATFAVNWVEATGVLVTGDLFFPPVPTDSAAARPPRSSVAALVHSTPAIGSTTAERLLALSIAAARRTLYITSAYFVPDDDFRRLLVAAARRGVDVRVLVPDGHTDIPVARYAGRSHYEELLRGGVRIYEYSPTMIHAKTMVVDGRLGLIGTMNLDNRSLALNDESVLVSIDPFVGATLDSLFLGDLAYAREIQLQAFGHRSMLERVRERGSALLSRLL